MNFITTFTKEIYEICGKDLLQSFVNTGNDTEHKLYVFFENEDDLYTEYYPDWLLKWKDNSSIVIANIMTYEYNNKRIVDFVDANLKAQIQFTDEYSSPRSVKWFRPVAAMQYMNEITNEDFCSIDSDCLFIKYLESSKVLHILKDCNVAYLGRESFKVMRHGGYDTNGNYVMTREVMATDKDTHTETGFLAFNKSMEGTKEFIFNNFNYWVSGDVLKLKYKTDCHTFDAVKNEMKLKYNNLCAHCGDVSPIGSRVLEASEMGKYMIHHKGTIGPILYQKNKL
jgi:hypothetical protein